jgi:hypothetical protein
VAQVFGPGANSFARFTLGGSVFGIVLLFGVLELYVRAPYVTQISQPVDQPVAFSHKLSTTGWRVGRRRPQNAKIRAARWGPPAY